MLCLLLVGGLTGIFTLLPDRLMLFPTRRPLPTHGAARATLPFRGGELELWTARTRPDADHRADVYVLRFYGNADRADPNVGQEIGFWAKRDVELWGVNYPGFGGSSGAVGVSAGAPAALTAYDALRARAGPDRPILVYGTSLGTTAALAVAARRPDVAGMILHNPPALRQIVLGDYGWWNLWLLAGPLAWRVPAALDSVANARAVQAKGVFVLAGADTLVRPRYQRMVADAYAGEKRVIPLPGASHVTPIGGAKLAEL